MQGRSLAPANKMHIWGNVAESPANVSAYHSKQGPKPTDLKNHSGILPHNTFH